MIFSGMCIKIHTALFEPLFRFLQVMTAASYWSLLAPAIDMAQESGYYGNEGQYAFVPVAAGFLLGAVFVYGADRLLPYFVSTI